MVELNLWAMHFSLDTQVFVERAYLVGIERKGVPSAFGIADSLAELAQLSDTAGLLVVGSTYQK